MMSRLVRSRIASLLAVPVLAVLLGRAPNADAAQVGTGPKKPHEPQKQSNQQLRQALHVLHSVKKTLEAADHDYGGHRAAAVHDVSAAAKQLRLVLNHGKRPGSGKPGRKPGQTGAKHPEPQVLSDQQLAQAIPKLHAANAVLRKANHDYGGHRAKAITDIHKAITQLEKALAFSKTRNKNKP